MRPRPVRRLNDQQLLASAANVYGNTVAARFLEDAVTGIDSLDIMCIGDSNVGNGNYGYTNGFNRVLNYSYGVPYYATPLFAGAMSDGPTNRTGTDFQPDVRLRWCGNNQAGTTGTVQTLVEAAVSTSPAYTFAQNLKTALGFDTTNYSSSSTRRLPIMQWGVGWYGAYVDTAVTYTSGANNNLIEIASTHPLNFGTGTGGVALAYRVVYGTFASGSGQFKLRAANNSTLANLATSASFISTNTGVDGYATTPSLLFNSPSTTPTTLICSWDGMNSGNSTTGPFACLWHSVTAQSLKGICSNTFLYGSGRTPTQIADSIEYSDKLLDSFIKELRERQVASGGSGRVLVFANMGINGSSNDNGAAYIAAANRIITRISARWTTTGGNLANLAFAFTVTHPTRSVGTESTWATNRVGIAQGVNDWAKNTASSTGNVCAIDIAPNYPAIRIFNASLYDAGGEAHLNATTSAQSNGYDAAAGVVIASLLASA